MIEDVEITDNEFLRQFELEVGDNMARIEYAKQDRKIFLTKYEMPEAHFPKEEQKVQQKT